jgi:putative membrane protein
MNANWGHGAPMHGTGFGIFGMVLGLIFFLLLFSGAVVLFIWIIKMSVHGGRYAPPPTSNALEILKSRYAKGEITNEEYDEMKKRLTE